MKPPEVVAVDFFGRRKYVVARVLQGGMGSVYQLVPIDTANRTVALKTIKGASSIRGFDAECEAWFSLAHHPNIARALAFGTWNSLPGVVIDWYPKFLAAQGRTRLSGERIMDLIRGTIDALDYAYSEFRLIHQDIKPANILIDQSEEPRLSDFGLAKCVTTTPVTRREAGRAGVREKATTVSGTPFYMAPELWHGMGPSLKTDIYSLGVTFYQSLTGQHPYVEDMSKPLFSDEWRMAPLKEALNGKGTRAPAIEEFVVTCLALDPAKRFDSYLAMDSCIARKPRNKSGGEWTLQRSHVVAGAAQFYSTKGDAKKAAEILGRPLREKPDDPVLLHALAEVTRQSGSIEQAEALLDRCYTVLKASGGVYEGQFVPDPILGRASSLITSGRFWEASDLIGEVIAWARNQPHINGPTIGPGSHPEIGWHLLFSGHFGPAADDLAKYSARHSPTKPQLIWLTEASWLAGSIEHMADELATKALSFNVDVSPKKGEYEFAWCRSLLRQFANPLLSERLWTNGPSVCGTATESSRSPAVMGRKSPPFRTGFRDTSSARSRRDLREHLN